MDIPGNIGYHHHQVEARDDICDQDYIKEKTAFVERHTRILETVSVRKTYKVQVHIQPFLDH